MQAPSGLSFISHLAINIFFALRKRFLGRGGMPPSAANSAAATCTAIILAIASFNLYGIWTTTYYGMRDSHNLEIATAAAKVEAADEKAVVVGTPQTCSAVIKSLSAVRPDMEENQNDAPKKFTTTIKKGQNLWQITRQLIMESLGSDPCADNANPRLCRTAMTRWLDRETNVRLRASGLIPSGNIVEPGTIVIMDGEGTVSIYAGR